MRGRGGKMKDGRQRGEREFGRERGMAGRRATEEQGTGINPTGGGGGG